MSYRAVGTKRVRITRDGISSPVEDMSGLATPIQGGDKSSKVPGSRVAQIGTRTSSVSGSTISQLQERIAQLQRDHAVNIARFDCSSSLDAHNDITNSSQSESSSSKPRNPSQVIESNGDGHSLSPLNFEDDGDQSMLSNAFVIHEIESPKA